MVVEKGYKMTEVGVIPEEWEVAKLIDVATLINGRAFKQYELLKRAKYLVLRVGNLFTNTSYYYSDLELSDNFYIERGDLIYAWSASFGPRFWEGGRSIYHYHIWKTVPKDRVSKFYLYHYLDFDKSKQLSQIQGGTMLHLTKVGMESRFVCLPPLREQTAIAEALSDMDAMIAQTEQLIEKKKAIKQGMMQELLKPKEGWIDYSIAECCDIHNHLRKPLNDRDRQKMRGDIPYCGANGIVDYINEFLTDFDIILMAEDGGYFDQYRNRPIAYKMSGRCWVNNHAHILTAKDGFNQDFIFYSLVHKNILDFISGGTRAKLNKSELLTIEVPIPNESTQNDVAQMLLIVDNLIQSLETKLHKQKQKKVGMMQSLLTGKIRLV